MQLTRHCLFTFIFLVDVVLGLRIPNIVPRFCNDDGSHNIDLKASGNDSVALIGVSILKNIQVRPNFHCYFSVSGPVGHGLIFTIRTASLNDRDVVKVKSNSDLEKTWAGDDEEAEKEVLSIANQEFPSSIFFSYVPAAENTTFNSGLDIAVTVFRDKKGTCGSDFDCQNNRCIDASLQCDGYNNCGNNQDEVGCSVSWWIIALLIAIAVVVVILAVFLWIRMSRG